MIDSLAWAKWVELADSRAIELLAGVLDAPKERVREVAEAGGHHAVLPFYTAYSLVRFVVHPKGATEPVELYVLWNVSKPPLWLDGTSDFLDTVNREEKLQLTRETVSDYLRFFYSCVRRPVLLLEKARQELENARPDLQNCFRPLSLRDETDDKGRFLLDCCVGNAIEIFEVTLAVSASGEIGVVDHQSVARDLPPEILPQLPKLNDLSQIPNFVQRPWKKPSEWAAFFRRHPGELEVIRAALPTGIVRNTINEKDELNHGHPILIHTRRGSLDKNTDESEEWLLIWKTREGAYAGYARKCRNPPRLELIAPDPLSPRDPLLPKDSKILGTTEIPWQGPSEPPRAIQTSEPDPGGIAEPESARASNKEQYSLKEQIAAVESSRSKIEKGDAVIELGSDTDSYRWWRQEEALDAESTERLLAFLLLAFMENPGTLEHRNWQNGEWLAAKVVRYELGFYRGYSLYRITLTCDSGNPRVGHFVASSALDAPPICCLGTTSSPIHNFNKLLNERDELNIDENTAAAYLYFFCRFVHGESGPFSVVERSEDLDWLFDSDKSIKETISKSLEPMRRLQKTESPSQETPGYFLSVFIAYGQHLFRARMKVQKSGMCDMAEDEPCFVNIPIRSGSWDESRHFALKANTMLTGFGLESAAAATCTDGEKWNSTSKDEFTTLIKHIESQNVVNFALPENKVEGNSGKCQFEIHDGGLPFYKDCDLYRITDRRGRYARTCYLILGRREGDADRRVYCHLGGSVDALIEFNKKLHEHGRLELTRETMPAYLAFYFKPYVQAKDYKRSIVLAPDRLRWLPGQRDGDDAQKAKDLWRPLRWLVPLSPSDNSALHMVTFTCTHRELGYARFSIQPDGVVKEEVDRVKQDPYTTVLKDLPILPERWEAAYHFVLHTGDAP